MKKAFIVLSVIYSTWKTFQRSRSDRFMDRLKQAQASLIAAVFQQRARQGPESSCSQHLPSAHLGAAALNRPSLRKPQREPTARDWTLEAAATQAAAGELPGGFQQHTTTLEAPDALHPCNKSIPVLLLWHDSFLPDGLAASSDHSAPDSAAGTDQSAPTAAGSGEGGSGAQEARRLPAVVWLHATGGSKVDMVPRMQSYAKKGFLAVAMDCRYHGERIDALSSCPPRVQYEDALYKAWSNGGERPFLLDNVRDLSKLLDFLSAHSNVDPQRIGMAGVSLGGMHTWLCAVIDSRVAAAAPLIGVQHFQWALNNDAFHGRVESLRHAFKQICNDCAKESADAAVVQNVWHRLLPGMLEDYDAPKSLPCIAPRPLMIVNGEHDPRCPIEGLKAVFAECQKAYKHWGCEGNLTTHIEPGAHHEVTAAMDAVVEKFFIKHLLTV
eukprot:jgi/Ulvmu1/9046/UM005_0139.1